MYLCKPMPSQKMRYVALRFAESVPVKKIWNPSRDHSASLADKLGTGTSVRRFERNS